MTTQPTAPTLEAIWHNASLGDFSTRDPGDEPGWVRYERAPLAKEPAQALGDAVVRLTRDQVDRIIAALDPADGGAEKIEAFLRAALSAHPAPEGAPDAWKWRNKSTGAQGCYFEDPAKFGLLDHPDYEWTLLYAPPKGQKGEEL